MRRVNPVVAVLVCIVALLIYSNWRAVSKTVEIPSCGVRLETPLGCGTRKWMNAIEVNCRSGNKIVYCNDLKQASPK